MSAWQLVSAFIAGGVATAVLSAWIDRRRYWRDRDAELIPVLREFAAKHRELIASEKGEVPYVDPKDWSAVHARLVPLEHLLPLWLQDGLNNLDKHSGDTADEARWKHLDALCEAMDYEWRSRSRRRQRRLRDRWAWWQINPRPFERRRLKQILEVRTFGQWWAARLPVPPRADAVLTDAAVSDRIDPGEAVTDEAETPAVPGEDG